ncbi:Uncharacterized conserved protein (some members contain a von Willebrand factor type A (vWA) domain) [Nocardia otitidiscaviarum]|uniref:Uncharacterized conserved protein (Some members contain a von Willebrand factor type A (VWA) domain) n=1 Tax=Nocardia otitidiscaviarum TaxID=1823 RepID=A0A378YER6_9NOCA|nr:DUF58 domain-containing protein [Nocardia otitidiscaviarum]SUA75725.1 Uncharacterized conserved protein (some members contain a von Willebrand factor type A (vWA) domain) [Nocardia otitidiscaviarum]
MRHRDTSTATEAELRWRPAPLVYMLAVASAPALVLAIVLGKWQLVVFAAPMLGVLATAPLQQSRTRIQVDGAGILRCFETEEVTLAVATFVESGHALLRLHPEPIPGMEMRVEEAVDSGTAPAGLRLALSSPRWGRFPVPIRVSALSPAGLAVASVRLPAGEVFVYPIADPQRMRLPRTELPERIGTHLTRRHGPGVEFADVRAYAPGDQLRTVNWPVSARRGRLFVTERFTNRAADVVVLVDTSLQAPGPASDSLELSVRGAAQVAQSALQAGDRTAVVCLGKSPRWLRPDIGRRQFYRIVDAVLDVGEEHIPTSGTLAPHTAVPIGAIVVAFSTLLDTQFALALIDLRKRGHVVVVVDVLRGAPFADGLDHTLARMWQLERASMYRDMGTVGVDIVAWPEGTRLDQVMRLIPEHRRTVRVRR